MALGEPLCYGRSGDLRDAVTDIFREVDEDLKRDQALQLWRRYGKYAIAFAVATVLMTAGIVGWQNYRESGRQNDGRVFAAAMNLVNRGDIPAATAAMSDIARNGGGYQALALLQEAGVKIKAGDRVAAAAIYDELAADDSASRPFRDLATILSAVVSIDTADPVALAKKLQPMTAEGAPFRSSALELEGLLSIKRGDYKSAKDTFKQLADDASAPGGLRQRATQILAWIGDQGGA
jgi:hypothetical protein